MNPLSTETGLLIASAVPVVVVGWAILFSVEAARRGPAWSFGHLGIVATVAKPALAIAIVAILVVRPMWVVAALAPLAALALVRSKTGQVGSVRPPSL